MYNIPMYRYILYRKGVLVVVTSIYIDPLQPCIFQTKMIIQWFRAHSRFVGGIGQA